jgi:hypothetical protein
MHFYSPRAHVTFVLQDMLQQIVYSVTVHVILFLWLDVVVLQLLRYRVLMIDCSLRYDHRLPRITSFSICPSPVTYVPTS